MATIQYTPAAQEFIGNTTLKLEDLNVALFIRLLGEVNPPGAPSATPVQARGMVDVAEKFKPAIEVKLTDEEGKPTAQKVRYHKDVKGGRDLADHFDPAWVAQNMENAGAADNRLGLLLRLLIGKQAMEALREALGRGAAIPPDVQARLEAAKGELTKLFAKLQEAAPTDPPPSTSTKKR